MSISFRFDRSEPRARPDARRLAGAWLALALACAAVPQPVPGRPGSTPIDAAAEDEFDQLWSRYELQASPKAFAFAYDGDDWVWGIVERAGDRSRAGELALAECERYRSREGVRAPCALYALDGEVVWTLRDQLTEFQSYPLHKAFWVAGTPDHPLFDAVLRAGSAEEAASQAMADCHAAVDRYGLDDTCRICQLDEGVPCTLVESGWPEE